MNVNVCACVCAGEGSREEQVRIEAAVGIAAKLARRYFAEGQGEKGQAVAGRIVALLQKCPPFISIPETAQKRELQAMADARTINNSRNSNTTSNSDNKQDTRQVYSSSWSSFERFKWMPGWEVEEKDPGFRTKQCAPLLNRHSGKFSAITKTSGLQSPKYLASNAQKVGWVDRERGCKCRCLKTVSAVYHNYKSDVRRGEVNHVRT